MFLNKKKTLALSENHALPIELTSPSAATHWLKVKLVNLSAGPGFNATIYFGKEIESVAVRKTSLSPESSDATRLRSSPSSATGDREQTTRTPVLVSVDYRVTVIERFCAGR